MKAKVTFFIFCSVLREEDVLSRYSYRGTYALFKYFEEREVRDGIELDLDSVVSECMDIVERSPEDIASLFCLPDASLETVRASLEERGQFVAETGMGTILLRRTTC